MRKNAPIRLLKQKKHFDIWLTVLTVLFCLFGLLMVYESSNVIAFRDFGDKYYFVKDQFTWFVVGLAGLTVTAIISYKKYYSLAVFLFIMVIFTLTAVFLPGIGIKVAGAHRWIGLGPVRFQPSEFTKLAVVLYLSSWLSQKEKGRLWAFLLVFFVIIGLVMLQPDLGTAVILTCIFVVMYFLSGAPIWHFGMLGPLILAGGIIFSFTSPYRLQRVMTFLNPNVDPLGASYHIRQVLISFGSGGFWGLGLGASRQKYQFLPAAMTDSIFAIIGEEFGFIGAVLLIVAYFFLLLKIFQIGKSAPDKQSFLMTGGILTLLGFQIIINLGSMVVLFPLTGVPLPFISYGGSNLIVTLISLGIVLNISRHRVWRS